jgi:hypothetical protein
MSKTCSKCNLDFELGSFLSGRNVCKTCRSGRRKELYAAQSEEKKVIEGEKKCSICNQQRDIKLFRVGSNLCVDCYNTKRREDRAAKNAPPPDPKKIVCPDGFKLCKDCLIVKKIDEFREKRQKCKKCENKDRVAYSKGQIQKQPIPEYEKDEDEFSKQLKASCRFRIRETIPKEIAQKLTEENRFGYVYDFLGCDMNFLKKWLRFCYINEMTDDNYGSYWFMDHVIPIHTFDIKNNLETNKKYCYSWFNISPLIPLENGRKFIEIDKKQLHVHLQRLDEYCSLNSIKPDENYVLLCAKYLDAGNPLESSITTSF